MIIRQPLILAAALIVLAGPAAAAAAGSTPPGPPVAEHPVLLTDSDVALLRFLATTTGDHCAEDARLCQAQLLLNDLVQRVNAAVDLEQGRPEPKPSK